MRCLDAIHGLVGLGILASVLMRLGWVQWDGWVRLIGICLHWAMDSKSCKIEGSASLATELKQNFDLSLVPTLLQNLRI